MAHALGKVILIGEHAVVYGMPAIGAAIGRGVSARARVTSRVGLQTSSTLRIEPWGQFVDLYHESRAGADPLARAFQALLKTYASQEYSRAGYSEHAVDVEAQVDLPSRAGLGCSAAIGVAVLRAIDETLGLERSASVIAEHSMAWERIFHGNPSGVDSWLSAFGGVLWYQKPASSEPCRVAKTLHLVIAQSGEYADTHVMVDVVRRQYETNPEKINKVLEGIRALAVQARRSIERGELKELGQLMTLNQKLLSSILLSTSRLEEMCAVSLEAGAHGAKLTGAGGGGCMVALAPTDALAVEIKNALERRGFESFLSRVQET